MDPIIGKLLDGRYKVTGVLSSGGFSQTYMAEDIRLPSCPLCVVKQLKTSSQVPDFIQGVRSRFRSEAEALEKLGTHDQIPQLLAFFEQDGGFYLVQEFVTGHALSNELLPGKQFSEAEVVMLLHNVLDVLKFIHAQQVIHRDIKPDNLIRRQQDGKLVLIDFGAVKAIQTAVANRQLTMRIGTPGYTPPEQDAGQPCFSSDFFALGMTAIQALTGIYPSQLADPTTGQVTWRHRVQISSGLAALLDRMICYRPAERYQSAQACLERLEAIEPSSRATATIQIRQQMAKVQSGMSPYLLASVSFAFGLGLIGLVLSIHLRSQTVQAALAQAKRLQTAQKYPECLEQTNHLLQGLTIELNFRHQAHKLLNQCQIGIDKQQVQKARQLAASGKLVAAITVASQIPADSQLQPEVQQSVQTWAQRLLQLGWDQYHAGNLKGAIAYAQSIPPATPDYQAASTIRKWQQDWQIAATQFRNAQQALDQGKWQQAVHLAQLAAPKNRFWQHKLTGVEREAKAAQQAEVATRSQHIARTLELLKRDLDQVGKNALKKAYADKGYKATEGISELRVRRHDDHVTFRLTVIAQNWFWTTEPIVFDWEVLMLQKQHVQATIANHKPLDKYHAEELNNYFLTLAEGYL